jgi:hypothetical protein
MGEFSIILEEAAVMKCIVELLDELIPLTPFAFAQRVEIENLNWANGQRIDFDNWLRRCNRPDQKYASLEHAYSEYLKSFG